MDTNTLTLYQYDYCPFCRKVRRFMEANHIDIPMKDTLLDPEAREELIQLGGKGQVPALRIEDKIIYESDDIIRWMRDHILVRSPEQ